MMYQCKRCNKVSPDMVLENCLMALTTSLGHDWVVFNKFQQNTPLTEAMQMEDDEEFQRSVPGAGVVCTMQQAHEALAVTDSAWHKQVGGNHYHQGGISPFEYSMSNGHNALEFSIVKYLRKKGDKAQRLEDLRKLINCAQKLLEWEEKDGKI